MTENWWDRMRGLLGADKKTRCRGLLLKPCNSIHTLLMAAALDVFFLDRDDRIVKRVINLQPWHMASCLRATSVLEVETGVLDHSLLPVGSILSWSKFPGTQ